MLFSRYIDQIAIALSAVCIVHCLAVPVLVAMLPIAALTFGSNGHFHELMLWVVVPTSLAGLFFGVRVHKRKEIVVVGTLGMLLIAIAALVGHDSWSRWLEISVGIVGSLVLALAHWNNFKAVRRCHHHVSRR
jgi:prepilin signal peptidase PulO-like enzyme (type II secretory pathway)